MKPLLRVGLAALFVLCVSFEYSDGRCHSGSMENSSWPAILNWEPAVDFNPAFTSDPAISYGLTNFDINYAENPRVRVELTFQNRSVARFRISTVHDTKLYGAGISWMACDSN